MLRKEIKYKDFDGNDATRVAYFHLNKLEWLELETFTKGGLIANLKDAIDKNQIDKTINILKKLILRAYGEKNIELNEFEKSDEAAIRFSKTDAFSELFYELAYDEKKSQEFFFALIPSEYRADAEKQMRLQTMKSVPEIERPVPEVE